MIISLFGDVQVHPGQEETDERMTARLEPILRSLPGFIAYKVYTADDGEAVGLVRMSSRQALEAWIHEGEHGAAQAAAADVYRSFWVQTAETYREYTWENGVRRDGDLTFLFRDDAFGMHGARP